MSQRPTFQLSRSTSSDNVYWTYVCYSGNQIYHEDEHGSGHRSLYGPDDESTDQQEADAEPIQIERTTGFYELVQNREKQDNDGEHPKASTTKQNTLSSTEESGPSKTDERQSFDNPNVIQLTKMKWLSEGHDGTPDSSTTSISPVVSPASSTCSYESDDGIGEHPSIAEKYLSTIIRLDKEHNMFGLSNVEFPFVASRASTLKRVRKDDDKPVFHQTAIVQICTGCNSECCKHQSRTALPASLRCGGGCYRCISGCQDPTCITCSTSCIAPRFRRSPYITTCCTYTPCPSVRSVRCYSPCRRPRAKPRCITRPMCCMDSSRFGLQVKLKRKPDPYEPPPPEITPRAPCILDLPLAARECTHDPICIPPSADFPYLMPCYWPARPSAPCTNPLNCFHNPPCLPPRRQTSGPKHHSATCPPNKCTLNEKDAKYCPNPLCQAKNAEFRTALSNYANPGSPGGKDGKDTKKDAKKKPEGGPKPQDNVKLEPAKQPEEKNVEQAKQAPTNVEQTKQEAPKNPEQERKEKKQKK